MPNDYELTVTPPHRAQNGELHPLIEVHPNSGMGRQDWLGPLHHYECNYCHLSFPKEYTYAVS